MRITRFALALLPMSLAMGCANGGAPAARQSPDRWLALVPAGTTANQASHALESNGFNVFRDGSVLYGYQGREWGVGGADGISMRCALDPDDRVAATQVYTNRINPAAQPGVQVLP